MVSLCALRWCVRKVSDCFISGVLPVPTISGVWTSRSQVLKLVRVLPVFPVVVHVLVMGVHIGGTYGEIAEVSCN